MFGVLADKQYAAMASRLRSAFSRAVAVPVNSPRALPVDGVVSALEHADIRCEGASSSVRDGLETAARRVGPGGVVVVAGSLVLIGRSPGLAARALGCPFSGHLNR